MSEAFVFINTFKVKEDKLGEYESFAKRYVSAVEGGEPDMMQLGIYLDEETMEGTAFQLHRTVENFAFHLDFSSRLIEESREFIDFAEGVRILGAPTEAILEQLRQTAGAGVHVSISAAVAGFERFG